jgi:hypothetical protein
MRRTSLALLTSILSVSPLAAQTWQSTNTPDNSNTGAYWNNSSQDAVGGAVCNIGGILTNTPGLTPTSCNNQAPVYLPLSPAPLTTKNVFLGDMGGSNPGAFRFAAGTYNFREIGRISGDLTTKWGIITDAGTVLNAGDLTGDVTVGGPFAVWITQALPFTGYGTVHSSAMRTGTGAIGSNAVTVNQQFAVFSDLTDLISNPTDFLSMDAFGTLINPTGRPTFFVGMEDNVNCGRGFDATCGMVPANEASDRDYNDIIIAVQPVPEPATVGLMGFGLLALAGIAKRRKA